MSRILKFALVFLLAFPLLTYAQDDLQKDLSAGWPGIEHKLLKKMTGKWRTIFSSWDEHGEATYGKGSSENKMIMGERYIDMNLLLTIENITVGSRITVGFDRSDGKYILLGLDEMGNIPLIAKGDYIQNEKKIVFGGQMPDMMNKGKIIDQKIILTMENDRKISYETYFIKSGKDIKVSEILFIKID